MDDLVVEVASGLLVGAGLGLVGAGGAIFAVPVFATALAHSPKAASTEALVVTGAVALCSGTVAAAKGLVDWRRVLMFGGFGIVGAQLAAPLAVRMSTVVQVLLFCAMAGIAAWRIWRSASPGPAHQEGQGPGSPWRSAAIGLGIGALTSILGVGGGFLLVPPLVVLERLPMRRAIGTSLLVISANCAAGLLGRWWSGGFADIDFHARSVAIVAGCGVVGSLVGAALQAHVPQGALRRAFAVLLAAAAGVMAFGVLSK